MEVYLDYNATTPLDPVVLEAMLPYLKGRFANASSFHRKGQEARHAIERAREQIAEALQVEPGDILFTSGGTESDNMALRGSMLMRLLERRQVVVSAIEHQAVLYTAKYLQSLQCELAVVPVSSGGIVDLAALEAAVSTNTSIVSLMHVNNEVGTIQPIEEAGKIAHAKGALFHVDAVQSFGKISIHPEESGIDLLSISAHKLCGPKGAGALYIRKGLRIKPILFGGHQEKNIRPGTENVAAIVGFGCATQVAFQKQKADAERVRTLRDHLEKEILEKIPGSRLNGESDRRIYNTCNVSFEGIDGETLLMNLDLEDIFASTGSACTAGSIEPSHVLIAMGMEDKLARAALRFSLGRFTQSAEIDRVLEKLPPILERLRRNKT